MYHLKNLCIQIYQFFTEIEDQLNGLRADNCNLEFCLLGDLNARTGVLSDFLDMTNDEQENNNGEECISLDSLGFKNMRSSVDKYVNNYGKGLLDLCKSLDMFIVNGRVGSDALIGKATCKNVSVVDYAICTPNVLTCINDFVVNDFDPMLSDVHCAVCLTLCCENTDRSINSRTHPETQLSSLKKGPTKPAWKPNLASDFKHSLNEVDISSILSELNSLGNEPRTQGAINNVVDQVNSLFRDVAYELNMLSREDKSSKPNKTRARHYPHNNQDCEMKRREYI